MADFIVIVTTSTVMLLVVSGRLPISGISSSTVAVSYLLALPVIPSVLYLKPPLFLRRKFNFFVVVVSFLFLPN